MNRTVICVEQLKMNNDGDALVTIRIEEPEDVQDADELRELLCSADEQPFADLARIEAGQADGIPDPLVMRAGARVFEGLSIHPGVHDGLNRAAQSNDEWPIIVETSAVYSESLPWESIFHPQRGFMALDSRWPIARVTGRRLKDDNFPLLQLPLKITAVLAAKDRDATPEWQALRSAVTQSQLPCQLTVFVSQLELKQRIERDNDPNVDVRVEMVPPSAETLVDWIVASQPRVLHVFSHGSADGGSGYLEIATQMSMVADDEPLYVVARDLLRLRNDVWLVVMNACEGAAPMTDAHSLAYKLVNEGTPAAIGMRESVDTQDAHVFCRTLFAELLQVLHAGLQAGNKIEMRWGQLMRAPRAALCARHAGPPDAVAASHKQWTLPVLYHRPGSFVVTHVKDEGPAAREDQQRLESYLQVLTAARERLHPDTPQDQLDEIDQQIADIQNQLAAAGA